MERIKFSISIPKDKKTVLMDALEYHDILFTCEYQEDQRHYYFKFELSPMELFELGGTFKEYRGYFEKKLHEEQEQKSKKRRTYAHS